MERVRDFLFRGWGFLSSALSRLLLLCAIASLFSILNGCSEAPLAKAVSDDSMTQIMKILPFSSTGGGGGVSSLNVSNFSASPGYQCACLSWTNPVEPGFAGVQVQRSSSGFPGGTGEGNTAYIGTGSSCTDPGLSAISHYYTAFVLDTNGFYSIGTGTAVTVQDHKWFPNFLEYSSNPVVMSGTQSRYYAIVLYDAASFGNSLGEDIDGAGPGGDTYTVRPYYKMWVGDGNNTDFFYSEDGTSWIEPAIGSDIVTNHYHPVVLYNAGGAGYRLWDWETTTYTNMDYFTSSDGISWTENPAGRVTPSNHAGPAFDNPTAPVYDMSILYEGTTFYAWINNNGHYYLMTSTDGLSWTNTGQCTLDISTMTNNYFSVDGRVWVNHINSVYEMWYSSDENGDFSGADRRGGISYAESTDGLNFTAVNSIDYKGTSAANPGPKTNAILKKSDGVSWRDHHGYSPMVLYDADKFSGHGEARNYKLYFAGDSDDTVTYPHRSVGYASFDRLCCE